MIWDNNDRFSTNHVTIDNGNSGKNRRQSFYLENSSVGVTLMHASHRVGSDLEPFKLNHEITLINEYYHMLNFTVGSTLIEVKFEDINTVHERVIRATRVLNRWILLYSSNLLTP